MKRIWKCAGAAWLRVSILLVVMVCAVVLSPCVVFAEESEAAAEQKETEETFCITTDLGPVTLEGTLYQNIRADFSERVSRLPSDEEFRQMETEEKERWYPDLLWLHHYRSELQDVDLEKVEDIYLENYENLLNAYASIPMEAADKVHIGSVPVDYRQLVLTGAETVSYTGYSSVSTDRYTLREQSNTSKDPAVYVTLNHLGKYYDKGTWKQVDAKVYTWLDSGKDGYYLLWENSGSGGVKNMSHFHYCGSRNPTTIKYEFHFFLEDGTEIYPSGYMGVDDLDGNELDREWIYVNNVTGWYAPSDSVVSFKEKYAYGCYEGISSSDTDVDCADFLFTFTTSEEDPLTITHYDAVFNQALYGVSLIADTLQYRDTGTVTVKKIIANESEYTYFEKADLSGFQFQLKGVDIYDGEVRTYTAESDHTGTATFPEVLYGSYTLTEIGADGEASIGFWWDTDSLNTSSLVEVSAENRSEAYTNIYQTGMLKILKTIEGQNGTDSYLNAETVDADALSGFAFRVAGMAASGTEIEEYYVTDEIGEITAVLPVGTYNVQEIKASEVPNAAPCKEKATQELNWFVLPQSQTVTVTYDREKHVGDTTILQFTNSLLKVQINLMDYDTERELDDAELILQDSQGARIAAFVTIADGNPVILGLEKGESYQVVETKAPEHYRCIMELKETYESAKGRELTKEILGEVPDTVVSFTVRDTEELQIVSIFNRAVPKPVIPSKVDERKQLIVPVTGDPASVEILCILAVASILTILILFVKNYFKKTHSSKS